MVFRKLVIDTNVFYSYIEESSYEDKYKTCQELLENIKKYCHNKVCYNAKILEEYKKFERLAKSRGKWRFYKNWKGVMTYNNKFKWVELANIKVIIKHNDDHRFYQTAYNTDDKIFITQEEKLLAKLNEVFEHNSIKTLGVEEANKIVIIEGPVEFENFPDT